MTRKSPRFIPTTIEAQDEHGTMAVRSLGIWHNLRLALRQITRKRHETI
jgi:hypothetical protein